MAILYYSTGGENWSNKGKWLGNGDHCDWEGITTCNAAMFIEEIDLSEKRLTGSLPPPAFQFQSLLKLYLHTNYLTGEIPDFNHLKSLEELELYDNALTTIPDFNLGSLTYLFLGYNYFSSVPDFKLMPILKELYLHNNALTTVPNFENLPKLTELYLQHTFLLTVPAFENLLDLTDLDISNNPLTSIPQSLCAREQGGPLAITQDKNVKCE